MHSSPEKAVHRAVQAFGQSLLASSPPPPAFASADAAISAFWSDEKIAQLEHMIESDKFADLEEELVPGLARRVTADAEDIDQKHGPFGDGFRLSLLQGAARARIEEQRQFQHRLTEKVVPYAPSDDLFAGETAQASVQMSAPMLVQAFAQSPVQMSAPAAFKFEDAVAAYHKAKKDVLWTKRTADENARILALAAEHFGATTNIATIAKNDVRDFRDNLLTWRRKPPVAAKLKDLLDAPDGKRIAPITAAKYFGYVSSAFAFWVDEGYLPISPVGKLSVKVPKGKKAGARVPFSDDDLKTLFCSPMYTGFKGPLRRTDPGTVMIRDGYYWIPLIAALSGMRVTEIVQLLLADIDLQGPVPFMRVQADADAGQSVKTDAGWRLVPIHKRLIELGFGAFVAERQTAAAKKKGRLFHDVPRANTGGGGGEFSKWFGRRMTALGLKKPGLVFHYFRHRFIDEMREHNTPPYILKAIVGHEGGDTTDKYGSKPGLQACREWIDKIAMLDALPPKANS